MNWRVPAALLFVSGLIVAMSALGAAYDAIRLLGESSRTIGAVEHISYGAYYGGSGPGHMTVSYKTMTGVQSTLRAPYNKSRGGAHIGKKYEVLLPPEGSTTRPVLREDVAVLDMRSAIAGLLMFFGVFLWLRRLDPDLCEDA